jgi:hypothetical protein
MLEFPTEFPADAVRLVIEGLRGRLPDYREGAKAAWNVAGFGLGQMLPGPAVFGGVELDDEQLEKGLVAEGDEDPAGAIPWSIIIPLVIRLIERWLLK